jgi:hypothetical protein
VFGLSLGSSIMDEFKEVMCNVRSFGNGNQDK